MGHGGAGPELLANETLMKEGQVIRSTTNQVSIHYRSLRQSNHGTFSLHYQGRITSVCFMSPLGSLKKTEIYTCDIPGSRFSGEFILHAN